MLEQPRKRIRELAVFRTGSDGTVSGTGGMKYPDGLPLSTNEDEWEDIRLI